MWATSPEATWHVAACVAGREVKGARIVGHNAMKVALLGISAAKTRLSRRIGIPLTRSGRQRKVGAALGVLSLDRFVFWSAGSDSCRPDTAILIMPQANKRE